MYNNTAVLSQILFRFYAVSISINTDNLFIIIQILILNFCLFYLVRINKKGLWERLYLSSNIKTSADWQ